jgi:hypothetical protein
MGDSMLNQPKLNPSYGKAIIAKAHEHTLTTLGEDSLLMMLPVDTRGQVIPQRHGRQMSQTPHLQAPDYQLATFSGKGIENHNQGTGIGLPSINDSQHIQRRANPQRVSVKGGTATQMLNDEMQAILRNGTFIVQMKNLGGRKTAQGAARIGSPAQFEQLDELNRPVRRF